MNIVRKKRKPQSSNQKSKSIKSHKNDVSDQENVGSEEYSPSSVRRQAFLGRRGVDTNLLKQLVQVSCARQKMQHQCHPKSGDSHVQSKSTIKSTPTSNLSREKSPISRSAKTSPLARKRSVGNILSIHEANSNTASDDLPRSLVRYSSHYNNNEKQNNQFY